MFKEKLIILDIKLLNYLKRGKKMIKNAFKFFLMTTLSFVLSSCGNQSGPKSKSATKLTSYDVENLIIGIWEDQTGYCRFYKDKSFDINFNNNQESSITQIKGEYEVVSGTAIVFYIKEGMLNGQQVYAKTGSSAGAKILEITPQYMDLRMYMEGTDFFEGRVIKKDY